MSILAFDNESQKILFDTEIRGQLSDGYWENARPHGHWKPWCHADAIVDAKNPGRSFLVMKENYALDSAELLGWIGDRMIDAVRKGTGNADYSKRDLKKDLKRMKEIFKIFRR